MAIAASVILGSASSILNPPVIRGTSTLPRTAPPAAERTPTVAICLVVISISSPPLALSKGRQVRRSIVTVVGGRLRRLVRNSPAIGATSGRCPLHLP